MTVPRQIAVNIKIGSGAYVASALFQEFRASGKCLKRRRENHLRDTTRQHHLSWLLASHPLQVRAGYNHLIPLFVTMSPKSEATSLLRRNHWRLSARRAPR